jgi:hypothetical protein
MFYCDYRKQSGQKEEKIDAKALQQQKKRKRDDLPEQGEKKQKTATGATLTAPKTEKKSEAPKSTGKQTDAKKNGKQAEEDDDKMDEDSDASDQRMLEEVLNMDSNDEDAAGLSDGYSDEADEEIDDIDE